MPTFQTPAPVTATVDLALGDLRITAGDRADTVVDVRPTPPSHREAVKAAELTRVEHANGQLLVKAPRVRSWRPRHDGGSISVTIELPAGSHLRGTGQLADFRCDGRLSECRVKTGMGRIELDRVDTLSVKAGIGDVAVDRVTGHADVSTGSGDVRVREFDDTGVL